MSVVSPAPSNQEHALTLDSMEYEDESKDVNESENENENENETEHGGRFDRQIDSAASSESDDDDDDGDLKSSSALQNDSNQENIEAEPQDPKTKWKLEYRRKLRVKMAASLGFTAEAPRMDALDNASVVSFLSRCITKIRLKNGKIIDYSPVALKNLVESWLQVVRVRDTQEIPRFVLRLFGDKTSRTELRERYHQYAKALDAIQQQLASTGLINNKGSDGSAYWTNSMQTIRKNLDNFYIHRLNQIDIIQGDKINLNSSIHELATLDPLSEVQQTRVSEAETGYSDAALLHDQVVQLAQRERLIRIEGRVYEPIYSPEGHFTRCYRLWNKTGVILSWIMSLIKNKSDTPELYGQMMARNAWRQLESTLKNDCDERFPVREESRYWYGFRNGLYHTETDTFYAYDSIEFQHLPETIVGCQYFDQVFDNDEYEYVIQNHPEGWFGLKAPELDRIPAVQKWSVEEAKWWYVGGGRMLYPSNYKEKWQRMWFHMGKAGTGKTTTLRFWMAFLPPNRIGLINQVVEKVFTLQGLLHTWAWFALDVGAGWQMDQKTWNRIVEGGVLDIFIKGCGPQRVHWDQHGAACANSWIDWLDINGEFDRRMFPHIYNVFPTTQEGQPSLVENMIKNNMGVSLKKSNCGYLWAVEQFGERLLTKDNMPAAVVANLTEMTKNTNPLLAFVNDASSIVLKPGYWMDKSQFLKAFALFMRQKRLHQKNIPAPDSSAFNGVLQVARCSIETDVQKLPWIEGKSKGTKPVPSGGPWVVGCCLVNQEQFQPNVPEDFQIQPHHQQPQVYVSRGNERGNDGTSRGQDDRRQSRYSTFAAQNSSNFSHNSSNNSPHGHAQNPNGANRTNIQTLRGKGSIR